MRAFSLAKNFLAPMHSRSPGRGQLVTCGVVPKGQRRVFFSNSTGFVDSPIYERERLGAGATLTGPAIVEQYDSTVMVPPDFWAQVDRFGNLILEKG